MEMEESVPRGKSWRREREGRERRLKERRGELPSTTSDISGVGKPSVEAVKPSTTSVALQTKEKVNVDSDPRNREKASDAPSREKTKNRIEDVPVRGKERSSDSYRRNGDARTKERSYDAPYRSERKDRGDASSRDAPARKDNRVKEKASDLRNEYRSKDPPRRDKSGEAAQAAAAAEEARKKAEQEAAKKMEEERQRLEEEQKRKEEEERLQREKEEEERKAAEEEERKKREEEDFLISYINETEDRLAAKAELRETNTAAAAERKEIDFARLDSSLKKNTAFVRKLKTFTESQKEVILREMATLNLTKYISEVASALVEVKLKMTDVPAAVDVCSALHQRYAEFSSHMLECWQKVLALKRDEKIVNPSKLRVDLRMYGDLVSVAVLPRKEALPLLGQALLVLINQDKTDHSNVSILLSFCKHSGDEYAGLLPRRIRELSEKFSRPVPQSRLLPPEKQRTVRQLFKEYYASLSRHLLRDHQNLQHVQRSNRLALQTKGELSAERRERLDLAETSYKKLLASTEQFSELVDEPMPELAEDAEQQAEQQLLEAAAEQGVIGDTLLLWEDDDQRSFYTNLPDLRASIPSILYSDSQAAAGGGDASPPEPEKSAEEMEDIPEEVSDEHLREPEEEPEPEPGSAGSSNKLLLDAFLNSLSSRVNRSLVDQAAVEFCMSLNTKNNRKKLVRALFNVPRTRIDLLPFYARLVATLQPCMPDVAADLAAMMKADFKYHVRKKDQINIETKLKVVKFIGELVKFGMYGKNEALWCVRVLLNDFQHHHVEMVCALLETCGRFLYRTAETHLLTKCYLEQLMRKKAAMSMDSRYITAIDNVYYTILPPEGATLSVPKVRPPLHNYLRKLIFHDLAKNNTEKVLRQLRRLDWADADTSAYAVKCLTSVWRIKYHHIRCLASLVAGLSQYQEHVGPQVVDNTLEDVRLGMEINDTAFNQRRISVARYLGELYNYRLLDTSVVFRVLYSLIAFGVSVDVANPSPLDPPGSEVRLRLVCVLLDTCGRYFSSGSARRQLDHYLVYLQRYFWARKEMTAAMEETFPVRLEYQYRDTIASLRPRLHLCASLEEATNAVEKLEHELRRRLAELVPALAGVNERVAGAGDAHLSTISEEEPAGSDAVGEDGDFDEPEDEESLSQQLSQGDDDDGEDVAGVAPRGTQEDDVEDLTADQSPPSEEREAAVQLAPQKIECEEDADFLTAFDRMISDSIMERSREAAKPQFELSAPISTGGPVRKTYGELEAERDQVDQPDSNTVQFLLLMRRGNKQQHRTLDVPGDSDLAVSLRSHEQAERQERLRVKQLTLNINERQEEEEMQELNNPPPSRPMNPNRDRRPKYQHTKGAPDADLIFGPKRTSTR